MTTRAYKKFASQEDVREILDEFSKSIAEASDDHRTRSVSEECIRRLSETSLPQQLRLLVSFSGI